MKNLLWLYDSESLPLTNTRYYEYITKSSSKYNLDITFVENITEINNSEIEHVFLKKALRNDIDLIHERKKLLYSKNMYKIIMNKIKTKEYLECILDSKYLLKTYNSEEVIDGKIYPIVLKETVSSQGDGVYLINSREELDRVIECIGDSEYYLEEYGGVNTMESCDYRVYTFGKELRVLIERKNSEFRSNVDKGGSVRILNSLEEHVMQQLNEIISKIECDYYALDMLVKDGKVKILELNTNPGVKGLLKNNFDYYDIFFKWYSGVLYEKGN